MKHTFKNIMIMCTAFIFLTACASSHHADWQPRYVVPEANVVMVQEDIAVDFVKGTCTPYLASKETALRALQDVRIDQVTAIDVYAHSAAQIKRAKNIVKASGLKSKVNAHLVPSNVEHAEDQAIITVSHWDARVDDCPNWGKPSGTDYNNSMGSSFGCSTAQNLAAMIVNPHDLKAGRTASPADSHQGVAAVNRYRTGDIIDIDRNGILSQ